MTHGSPEKPAKNPHPVKRYEVTATSQGPGPWDSIKGYIGYEVINKKCVPMDSFLGEQSIPNTMLDIEMTRVDDKTWRGYFYRDALQDEDYYKLGVCHWDVTDVSASFTAQSISFSSGSLLKDFLHSSSQTEYFKKSSYGDRNLAGINALQFLPTDTEVIKQPDAFFPITVTVKEITP
jgi:hypothetical protein